MSVIRKKPFIESVIEDLTDEQKEALLSVMNGSETTESASFTDLPEDDVAPVLFELEPNNLKTGILIQGSTYNVLLAYHRFQDMQIFNLDLSKFTFEKVNEYLDINELRRVLGGNGGGGSGNGPKIYEGNIAQLSSDVLEQLKNGDVVVDTGSSTTGATFTVSMTSSSLITLTNLDGPLLNTYSYAKSGQFWDVEHYQDVFQKSYTTTDIESMDILIPHISDAGDVVRDEEGNCWTISFDYDSGYFYLHSINGSYTNITFCRYFLDGETGDYSFDYDYGTDGYNTIPLGGTTLYKHTLLLTVDEADDTELNIISATSTPYGTSDTLSNIYDEIAADALNGNIISKTVMGLEAFSLEKENGNFIVYVIASGTITPVEVALADNTSITDTVTRL